MIPQEINYYPKEVKGRPYPTPPISYHRGHREKTNP